MSHESFGSNNKLTSHWIHHLGQGNNAFGNTQISDLLNYTGKSEASDMRDRLFGIISLVREQQLRVAFLPDYSISRLHFCIGTLAHLLLVEGDATIFYNARTITGEASSTPSQLPSWFPSPITIAQKSQDSSLIPYGLCSWTQRFFSNTSRTLHVDIRCTFFRKKLRMSSDTGSITLTLTYLFVFDQNPILKGTGETITFFMFTTNPKTTATGFSWV
jgi:hypothetical protein